MKYITKQDRLAFKIRPPASVCISLCLWPFCFCDLDPHPWPWYTVLT